MGVNVVYGMIGLKIHCKMTLILRQEEAGLRYYTHLSSGNYNERTATLYTDLGLMTCNREIGQDVSELFNLLTGYSRQESWRQILVAPIDMRRRFIETIDRCIAAQRPEQPSRIQFVMNSLVDEEIIAALYRASQAGVQIQGVVRGICCLVPGVAGLSDNISIRSIVGRFLEHVRLYCFTFEGQTVVYTGSADWMPRNLSRRVEVAFPILDEDLRRKALDIVAVMLNDTEQARQLRSDGTYLRIADLDVDAKERTSAQEFFLGKAEARQRLIDTTHNTD